MRTRVSQISTDEPLRTRVSNAGSTLTVAPSGTGVGGTVIATSSSDVANTSQISISVDGTTAYLISGAVGTGVQRPLSVQVAGVERMRITVDGVGFNQVPAVGAGVLQATGLAANYTAAFM